MRLRPALAGMALLVTGCNLSFGTCLPLPTSLPPAASKLGVGIPDAGDEVKQIEAAMTFLEQAGVTWARVPMSWSRIQPTRTTLNWRGTDALVESARRHGVKLHVVVKDTTPWASSGPLTNTKGSYPPTNFEDWQRFMLVLAGRYRDDVNDWEIGDAIDTRAGWSGRPEQYTRLLSLAGKSIKALNPKARVILGSVTFGPDRESLFLESVLQDRSFPVAPIITAVALRPGPVTPAQIRERYFALRRSLDRIDAKIPIVISGVGWSSDDGRQRACESYQGGDSGQARYLREVLPWLVDLGADRVFWEYLWDGLPDAPSNTLGLIDRQVQAKAALGALSGLIDPNRIGNPMGSDVVATPSDVAAVPSPSARP